MGKLYGQSGRANRVLERQFLSGERLTTRFLFNSGNSGDINSGDTILN